MTQCGIVRSPRIGGERKKKKEMEGKQKKMCQKYFILRATKESAPSPGRWRRSLPSSRGPDAIPSAWHSKCRRGAFLRRLLSRATAVVSRGARGRPDAAATQRDSGEWAQRALLHSWREGSRRVTNFMHSSIRLYGVVARDCANVNAVQVVDGSRKLPTGSFIYQPS